MPTSSPGLIDLLCRWQQQRRLGIPVDVEQLCANTPELLEALKQQIAALESMERLLGTNLTIDGVDHAAATVDREATTGGFDAGRTTSPQQMSVHGTIPSPPGYEVLSELGRGGMGVVYKALQVKAKRIVVLKMILSGVHASQSALERFRIEGESIARLQHPNIVQVFDVGEYNRTPYFALEFCDGGNLAKKLAGTPLLGKDAAILVEKLARAVAEAHAKGIIHRDLKPANVLLTVNGEPKVTDFGLAKQLDQRSPLAPREASVSPTAQRSPLAPREEGVKPLAEREDYSSPLGPREASVQPHAEREDYTPREEPEDLTHTGAVMGTPSYMAPEQASGDTKRVGPPCDVYALGVILYECLTGRPPFKGLNYVETLDQVRHQEPVPPSQLNSKVPRDLETICLKCLRKEPGKRYAVAAELADDVRRYLDGKPIVARAVGRGERAVKWVKRNPVVTGATLAVVLALSVGATVSYLKYLEAEDSRGAESARVKERDKVIGQRNEAIAEREIAIKDANDRLNEKTYQLGITNFLLAASAYENRDGNLTVERLDSVEPAQRGWEWYYLKRRATGGLFTLSGHTNIVTSVAFSPDGTRIVTGSVDMTAKVWDARTGAALVELKGHMGRVNSVAFSPDGTWIVTGSVDRTAKVWDARSGTIVLQLKEHTGAVNSVAFSPDGTSIVTGSEDQTAKMWDARSGAVLVELIGHRAVVETVAFSPDGGRIVTGSSDSTAKVWDARTGSLLLDLKGRGGWVHSVAFSPNGMQIVTGNLDRTAKVWDAHSGASLVELKGHSEAVNSVSFSPDGTRIITGGDSTAKVWDARRGAALVELKGHSEAVNSVSFSPDGTRIITGGGNMAKVWDARNGNALFELNGHTKVVTSVTFAPDDTRIVTGSEDQTVRIWDARKGNVLLELNGHTDKVTSVAFSPNCTRIATGSVDMTAKVWDARSGTALFDLNGHSRGVAGVAFSPDNASIVTGSWDGTARVWDANSGSPLLELKQHAAQVTSVAFSPDGRNIVTGSWDGTARVWDANSGSPLLELNGHTGGINGVAYSPNGMHIVTGGNDNSAKMWDARNGSALFELKGHLNGVTSVAFSPDSGRIVTCSDDRTAKVWDARSGTALLELKGHTGKVTCVTFSQDGKRIVTGSWDRTSRVWDYRGGAELWKNGAWNAEEFSYRLDHTRPELQCYRDGYQAAQQAKDVYSMQFYLDRALSMFPTTANLRTRNQIHSDLRLIVRTTFHHSPLANTPYERSILHTLALNGDRLAKRLVAQECIRDAKPQAAIPILFECLLSRPITHPPKPPVEELLLAQAYLDMKDPEQANRIYRAAAEWLERYEKPIQAMNIVSHCTLNPWAGLGEAFAPIDDPRRNPFDWESWHECDVFRAEVERRLTVVR